MATKDIYEKGKLDIKVKLKEKSKKETDTARLILVVDGVDKAPITLTVKKQTVTHNHVFEDVAATKDNYLLTYRVEHDTETIRSSTEYRVWPLTAKVKLVNQIDFAPLKDIAFDLLFEGGAVSHFRTGADGTCLCKLKQKALFSIPSLPHVSFMEWQSGKDHGRDRVANMLVVQYKADLVSPAGWAGTEVKQYVNLASANTGDTLGHDNQGTKVAFKVKLVDALDATRPVTAPIGHDVFLKATLSEMTKRNAKLPTFVGATILKTSKTEVTAKVQTIGGGTATFTLQLGLGGKEKVKLQVGTTAACADFEVDFEGWRKLWLQSIAPAGKKPALDDAVGAMEKVGIELLAEPDVDIAGAAPPAGSIVPGATFGVAGDQVVVGDHNVTAFTALWTKTNDPLSAYAVFCDFQFDGGEVPQIANASYDFPETQTIAWPPGGDVRGFVARPLPASQKILAVNLQNGNHAVQGTWTVNGPADSPHLGATGAFDAADLHVDWATGPGLVWVRAPAALVPILDDGAEVTADLDVAWCKGPYNGWAPDPPVGGVVIALRNGSQGERPAHGMNQTLVHELGHLLNQVNDTPGAGVALSRSSDHKWNYTGRGHSGGHCAFGVSWLAFKTGGSMAGKSAAICVMYGEGSDTRGIDYCVKCAPFVKAEPMESLT